jgi:GH15 family glucan-1,4-alpha-glucosidase
MDTPNDAGILPYIRERYSTDERSAVRTYLERMHTFTFVPLAAGLYAATTPSATTEGGRYRYAWVRDNVYVAHALWCAGRTDEARRTASALVEYMALHAQRFEACITGQVDTADPMQRPHVRINGDTLEEVDEVWPHAQNDAHGLFLWLTGTLVEAGVLPYDTHLHETVLRTIRFLDAIHFYTDADSGVWEEGCAVRASSIGAVCAGLRAWQDILHDRDHTSAHRVYELVHQGMQALTTILPYEVRTGTPGVRAYDAALLFLVEPLNLVTGTVAETIVDQVRDHLMGERGIRRYAADSFWGPNYDTLSAAVRTSDASTDDSFRAAYAVPGQEAEWTVFDPLIARYYTRRARAAEQPERYERLAATHLNRTLAALVRTKEHALLLPELYYHKQGTLTPNTIVPLYWAQANLLRALVD